MIIRKHHLGRRTFLRGAGAAVALPFLDCMVPALAATPGPVIRTGAFYIPNGVIPPSWEPAGAGGRAEGPAARAEGHGPQESPGVLGS